MLFINFRI